MHKDNQLKKREICIQIPNSCKVILARWDVLQNETRNSEFILERKEIHKVDEELIKRRIIGNEAVETIRKTSSNRVYLIISSRKLVRLFKLTKGRSGFALYNPKSEVEGGPDLIGVFSK